MLLCTHWGCTVIKGVAEVITTGRFVLTFELLRSGSEQSLGYVAIHKDE